MGSQNIMGSDYGSNISEVALLGTPLDYRYEYRRFLLLSSCFLTI